MINVISGKIQPYAWGSTTAIPEILGQKPTGEPQAELWFGAHPKAPSELDGAPLTDIVENDPAVLGPAAVQRFGNRLPYLIKLIAAAQPLSLQAHPTRAQAEAGFARENEQGIADDAPERVYRDDWPKPEMVCALGDFEALCGFRNPIESYALFSTLGVDQVLEVVEPLRWGGPEAVQKAFARLLYARQPEMLVSVVISLCQDLVGRDDAIGGLARTAVELGRDYPTDPGVLAALLMNRVSLTRFDALFLPEGNLHAYLKGTAVEVMANSDNVLRGGLTRKHVAVDDLLESLDFTPRQPELVAVEQTSAGVFHYQTPAPEFGVWRLEPGGEKITLPAEHQGRILMVTDGDLALKSGHHKVKLGAGRAAFVSADEEGVVASGSGVGFLAAPGV